MLITCNLYLIEDMCMNNFFRGYQIHNYQYYLPQNVLLSNENEKNHSGYDKRCARLYVGENC